MAIIILVTCASFAVAQLSTDDVNTLIARQKDGADPHEVALAMSGVERILREGSETIKLSGTLQAIDLAALIYRTHDTSVPTDGSVGRLPDFDATKFGGKPIFIGADPESIIDPKIRAAYKKAIAEHEQLAARVAVELQKLEEGDYCARVAVRVIQASGNPTIMQEAVGQHLASLKDADWIKERLTKLVLPAPAAKENAPSGSAPATSDASEHQQARSAVSPPPSVQPPASKKAPEAKPAPTPSEEPASSTPWSIIVVLIVAAIGLLWLLLKQRTK